MKISYYYFLLTYFYIKLHILKTSDKTNGITSKIKYKLKCIILVYTFENNNVLLTNVSIYLLFIDLTLRRSLAKFMQAETKIPAL